MTEPEAEIVRFDHVGLRYGSDTEVITDVSFTLFPGTFDFLTGASGAGKTSLLKLLYLAQRPSRGKISMFGTDAITLPRERLPGFRRRLGVVFQDFRLIPHLSAFDNVALPLRVAGVERMVEINLTDRRGMLFPMLLGRTALARAFVIDPARSFLHGKPSLGVPTA